MRDIFWEVYTAMSYNKMRIALTGFSIGWGIFLLIVMLGAGNGVLHGIINGFASTSDNIIELRGGTTSLAYNGQPKGRDVTLMESDCQALMKQFDESIDIFNIQLDSPILFTYGTQKSNTSISGIQPGYNKVKQIKITEGRDINYLDLKERRKVCVISKLFADNIFKDEKTGVIGKSVNIYNIPFTVVGVYTPNVKTDLSKIVYAPLNTVRHLYYDDDRVSAVYIIARNLDTVEKNKAIHSQIRNWMAQRLNFNPADRKAFSINSYFEQYLQITNILIALQVFIWIVGLATLLAGIVGISNIMLITVKERIKELGVRKAMGASSLSIVRLVLIESVIITVVFGYVGMLIGIGLMQGVSALADSVLGPDNTTFTNPNVSLSMVLIANCVLIVCGLIAGYIPAKKAVSVKLVDALAGIA